VNVAFAQRLVNTLAQINIVWHDDGMKAKSIGSQLASLRWAKRTQEEKDAHARKMREAKRKPSESELIQDKQEGDNQRS
jgi:hypothetical protein